MKRRILPILLAAVFCVTSLSACATGSTAPQSTETPAGESCEIANGEGERVITDSLGREVTIPQNITRIIPTGQLAQITLLSLCPDLMVGIACNWEEPAKEFLPSGVIDLPIVGQLYGGKKDFNLESILAADPQVIVDVGDAKQGMAEDLDALEEQIGVPVVHVDGNLSKLSESYKLLGDIVGRSDAAEERIKYVEAYDAKFDMLSSRINPINMLLITGPEGLNVIPKGSYQGEAFEKFANNLAVVEEPSAKGTGNEVDMEQILKWNPDVIIYLPETTGAEVFEESVWQEVKAVKNGQVYHVPYGPYNWLGFPASVQRYLGMMWMVDVFYPEWSESDLYDEVKTYFNLFYGYDLSKDRFKELISQD